MSLNISWQLAVGSWQLAVGSWQLAVGNDSIKTNICQLVTAYCQLSFNNYGFIFSNKAVSYESTSEFVSVTTILLNSTFLFLKPCRRIFVTLPPPIKPIECFIELYFLASFFCHQGSKTPSYTKKY